MCSLYRLVVIWYNLKESFRSLSCWKASFFPIICKPEGKTLYFPKSIYFFFFHDSLELNQMSIPFGNLKMLTESENQTWYFSCKIFIISWSNESKFECFVLGRKWSTAKKKKKIYCSYWNFYFKQNRKIVYFKVCFDEI